MIKKFEYIKYVENNFNYLYLNFFVKLNLKIYLKNIQNNNLKVIVMIRNSFIYERYR